MQPIEVKPTRDRVAAEIRASILFGEFPENYELTQESLAAALGVSRMPVREAIQLLATEGLVTLRPNRTAIVNKADQGYIEDYFDVRLLLETEAFARACVRMEGDLEAAKNLIAILSEEEKAIEIGSHSEFNSCNHKFHSFIWSYCGNKRLEAMVSQLWFNLFADNEFTESIRMSHQEHIAVGKAIIAGDVQKCKDHIIDHLLRSKERALNSERFRT